MNGAQPLEHLRWRVVLVLMLTMYVGWLDRINITFALPLMAEDFAWSDQETARYGSMLMGLFYAAYGLANMLLTPIAERFGPRRCLLLIVCLWSIFTALGAWLSQWIALLLATRVLLGLSEGVHVPMMTLTVKRWFPPRERARANSVIMAGIFLSLLSAPAIMVPLMDAQGWRQGFVLIAAAGLLLSLPLVFFFIYDTPQGHPRIAAEEKNWIERSLATEREAEQHFEENRWWQWALSPNFLLITLIGIINGLVTLGVSGWLPTYFSRRWDVAYEDVSWVITAPYALNLAGLALWAWLGDRFNLRAGLASFGFLMAGLMLFLAFSATSLEAALVFFCAGVFAIASYSACEFALAQRVLPVAVFATCFGIFNGVSTLIGGGLGPALVAPLIADGSGAGVLATATSANALLLWWVSRRLRY